MSEAKVCEVCKLPEFQGGEGDEYCHYAWGLDCMIRGYERERAAREKAEAALAAAERRGLERAADGCDHYAVTAKVAGDVAAAAVATILARSIRARAAEPEKAS